MVRNTFFTGTIMTPLLIGMLFFGGCNGDNGQTQPPAGQDSFVYNEAEEADEPAGFEEAEPEPADLDPSDPKERALADFQLTDTGLADPPSDMDPYANTVTPGSHSARQPVTIPPEVINPEYKALLNEDNQLVVTGRTVDELLDIIGEPLAMLRQGQRGSGWHREVWILPIYREDSTGLYLYIENGKVTEFRLDTFVGIGNHPGLLEWFQ